MSPLSAQSSTPRHTVTVYVGLRYSRVPSIRTRAFPGRDRVFRLLSAALALTVSEIDATALAYRVSCVASRRYSSLETSSDS